MFGKKKASGAMTSAAVSAPAASAPAAAGAEISPEIIAVITAAIAAMTSNSSVSAGGLIIRKISRIHGEKVSWSNAGLMECIDSRRI